MYKVVILFPKRTLLSIYKKCYRYYLLEKAFKGLLISLRAQLFSYSYLMRSAYKPS